MNITHHGKLRQQQRGIPSVIVDLVLTYGSREHDNQGGVTSYLNRRSRKAIEQDKGREFLKRYDNQMNVYVVQSAVDGCVITCGHRHTRINRH
ncbi:MAG: hypothetical protein KKH21_11310 [Gammaproteobacteria bacterium]|uniref:hypothetical protein n=1 Tax=Acidovorax sp. TaxID=1872122 RepID=UPI0040384C56|nr:hypothetical protein [Gammaproteobacteria bacterium]MBU1819328.1 hypothetical protein [Gammaproteobacteria bacterium]